MKTALIRLVLLLFMSSMVCAPATMAGDAPDSLEIASVWVLKSDVPDPGAGWNGWYTNLYGLTETLFHPG